MWSRGSWRHEPTRRAGARCVRRALVIDPVHPIHSIDPMPTYGTAGCTSNGGRPLHSCCLQPYTVTRTNPPHLSHPSPVTCRTVPCLRPHANTCKCLRRTCPCRDLAPHLYAYLHRFPPPPDPAVQDGHTPLLAAAAHGKLEAVKALLAARAEREAKDQVGER